MPDAFYRIFKDEIEKEREEGRSEGRAEGWAEGNENRSTLVYERLLAANMPEEQARAIAFS